jgi:hypothetical protein
MQSYFLLKHLPVLVSPHLLINTFNFGPDRTMLKNIFHEADEKQI